MSTLDKIKELCERNNMSLSGLEKVMGYGNGSLSKSGKIPFDRIVEIANYFGVSVEYFTPEFNGEYYINKETVEMAQTLFDDPNYRMLFDAAKDSRPEDLKMAADMLNRMKGTNPNG